jgi:hypothetical protein
LFCALSAAGHIPSLQRSRGATQQGCNPVLSIALRFPTAQQCLVPRVLDSLCNFRGPFGLETAEMGGNQALFGSGHL